MSALSNFLYSCLPEADYALLEPMLTRFNQDYVDDAFPSLQKPFKLSSAEVAILIELAIKNHSERLLVALASMGTVELMSDNTIKDPVEPLIGQRDSTIETALIAKALALQSAKEKDKERPCRYVYGLSGNPPTLNHLHFIEHLVRDGEATVVLNAQSPLKALDSYVEPNLRFDMLHLMIDSLDEYSKSRCTLSRLEIDRPPPSRMVVTMSLLTLLAQKDEQLTLVL